VLRCCQHLGTQQLLQVGRQATLQVGTAAAAAAEEGQLLAKAKQLHALPTNVVLHHVARNELKQYHTVMWLLRLSAHWQL
jgi:hypothetical protein